MELSIKNEYLLKKIFFSMVGTSVELVYLDVWFWIDFRWRFHTRITFGRGVVSWQSISA